MSLDVIRSPRRVAPTLAAILAGAVYLVLQPTGADLPAQLLRAKLFSVGGFGIWDNWWYAGHNLLSYSVLFGPLAWLSSPQVVGAVAGVITAAAFEAFAYDVWGEDAWLGATWLGAATVVELLSGRLTFAAGLCGVAVTVLALQRQRGWVAAIAALLTALASPVAALFAALAGATVFLTALPDRRGSKRSDLLGLIRPAGPGSGQIRPRGSKRSELLGLIRPAGSRQGTDASASRPARSRQGTDANASRPARSRWGGGRTQAAAGIWVVIAALLPVAALEVAFPQGGSQPFTFATLWPLFAAGVALLILASGITIATARTLRIAIVLYLAGCLAAYLIPTAVGANAARLGELAAGPLTAMILLQRRALLLLVLVAVPLTYIQIHDAITDLQHGSQAPSDTSAYYRPLIRFLQTQPGARGHTFRVEVPFTQGHWEAYRLAPVFPLARGWERQLDVADDHLFYGGRLTAATYERWLHQLAVGYVAVTDATPDYSARAEISLIDGGLPYLRLVRRLPHWRVFRVAGATPIASGSATLTALDVDSLTLAVKHPGSAYIRVRWSPYWKLSGVRGCVAPAGAFTRISAWSSGTAHLSMDFSLARVAARSPRCN